MTRSTVLACGARRRGGSLGSKHSPWHLIFPAPRRTHSRAIVIFRSIEKIAALALLASLAAALLSSQTMAQAKPLRIAVLKFGTVSWELDVVSRNGLDRAEGIELEIVELASGQAAKVALQAGSVDVIVTDWFWVLRARAKGGDFVFSPYSGTLGDIMVPAESAFRSIDDLAKKKIGVAGGPLDKSWLIMRALYRQRTGQELADAATPVFAAPPLLNQKAEQRELDAALNYWPYAARLAVKGFRRLIGVSEALRELGLEGDPVIVGYTFRRSWAEANHAQVEGFLRATLNARKLLYTSDAEWREVRPLMRAENEAIFVALRDRFRSTNPDPGRPALWRDAERLYRLLSESGGEALLGGLAPTPESFWKRP